MSSKLAIASFIFIVLAGWFCTTREMPHGVAAGDAKKKDLTQLYFGVSLCRKCHDEKQAIPDAKALLYRGTEMHTWDQLDKHKDATKVLKDQRSREMAKALGYDVATDRRCLSCHGVVLGKDDKFDEDSFSPALREESGVSCVVCHGPYQEWVNNHALVIGSTWKKLTRAEKERDHGLRDMWNPATRAALCCSCHVGNVKEGKVVTHEMYAAGHPPLPGIEVATFSDAMPRHWEYLSEKVAKRPQHKEFHKRVHGYDADRDDNEQARLLAVSSLVALRASVQLVYDLAGQEVANPNANDPVWPELASFDCYACHHDLKSDSWRLLRTTSGRPGRPQLRPWPTALAEITVQHTAKHSDPMSAADFQVTLKELDASFGKVPFGEPRAVIDRAGALLKSTDKMLKQLESASFGKADAREFLTLLLHRPRKDLLEFDSARQIAWASQSMLHLLEPAKSKTAGVQVHLDLLKSQLRLDLIVGQKSIATEFYPDVLKRIATYDPREFQKTMADLAAEVAK